MTLCTLGPLTNVAMALIRAPEIAPRIREIVMMGGAYFEVGNITPTAEFNIYVDPEAADVVLRSRRPDHHAAARRDPRRPRPRRSGSPLPRARQPRRQAVVADMLGFSERFDREKYGWRRRAACTTPTSSPGCCKPELYEGRQINVAVECASPLTLGMTVADYWRVTAAARQRPVPAQRRRCRRSSTC